MERANGTSRRSPSLRNAARAAEAALALLLALLVSLPWPSVVVAQDEAQGDAQSATFSPEQLEQVVAPIALYPDSLLAQVMMASTYPLEIVEAARWAKEHPGLKDKALDDALQSQTWDASVKSLVAFPQVLTMMNDELAWTQKLGDAFLAQQSDVMYAVQVLRSKAKAQGNLESGEQQRVIVEPAPQGETTVIRIEPASPQVVYVPTYNPTVVYGSWPYPSYPPYSYYPPGYTAAASVLSFGVGMAVGAALWGGYNWGGGYGHGYGHGNGNVNVNYNNYNNFNSNVNKNWNQNNVNNKFQDGKWQHDASHRKGVEYRDKSVQDRYGKGNRGNAQSREAFRGRADQGRQQMARDGGASARKDLGKQGGAAGFGNQGGAGQRDRAGAAQQDRAAAGNRSGAGANKGGGAGAGNRAGAAQRDRAAASNRGGGDRRSPSAFGGQGSGQQVRRDSSRGQASQQSARASSSRGGSQGGMRSGGGGGSRGGGGGSRGGGGGSRGGGGGGRGGGGGGRGR